MRGRKDTDKSKANLVAEGPEMFDIGKTEGVGVHLLRGGGEYVHLTPEEHWRCPQCSKLSGVHERRLAKGVKYLFCTSASCQGIGWSFMDLAELRPPRPEEEADPVVVRILMEFTVDELKGFCREHEILQRGGKAEVAARLAIEMPPEAIAKVRETAEGWGPEGRLHRRGKTNIDLGIPIHFEAARSPTRARSEPRARSAEPSRHVRSASRGPVRFNGEGQSSSGRDSGPAYRPSTQSTTSGTRSATESTTTGGNPVFDHAGNGLPSRWDPRHPNRSASSGLGGSLYMQWLGKPAGDAWGVAPIGEVRLPGTPISHPHQWLSADEAKAAYPPMKSQYTQRCQQCGRPMTREHYVLKGGLGWVHWSCVEPSREPPAKLLR